MQELYFESISCFLLMSTIKNEDQGHYVKFVIQFWTLFKLWICSLISLTEDFVGLSFYDTQYHWLGALWGCHSMIDNILKSLHINFGHSIVCFIALTKRSDVKGQYGVLVGGIKPWIDRNHHATIVIFLFTDYNASVMFNAF